MTMPSPADDMETQKSKRTQSNASSEKPARPIKRSRIAAACQRCKTRKQKCSGQQPCENCKAFGLEDACVYVPHKFPYGARPVPDQHQQRLPDPHGQSVEERLAQLENLLRRQDVEKMRMPRPIGSLGPAETSASETVARPSSSSAPSPEETSPASPAHPRAEICSNSSWAASTVVDSLRDLSVEASGCYFVGESSQISLGRMISAMVEPGRGDTSTSSNNENPNPWEHLSPRSANTNSAGGGDFKQDFTNPSPQTAAKLFNAYIRHISTRWPVIQTPFLRLLHAERDTLTDVFFINVLHLVYAIGGRFLETTGEMGDFYPEQHFERALADMDKILRLHDIRSVQYLLLLSIYSLRSPGGPGAWTYAGLAMRLCIELGLHRKTRRIPAMVQEMRKRVFWTCYCLDRQVSILLGRPFAISDRDIDAEMPLDVDESAENINSQQSEAQKPDPQPATADGKNTSNTEKSPTAASPAPSSHQPPSPVAVPPKNELSLTSLTHFIHMCRLRIIESQIQQSIYRVDESSPATEAEIERFIDKLERWRESIPKDASTITRSPGFPNVKSMLVDGYDNYMVYYYKCMRFLLHPIILSSDLASPRLLQKCAEAAGGVCRTYKKLHQTMPVGFSVMALHSIFLAGLTLIYCTWAAPKDVFSMTTNTDMNACSIILYIITERWPGARKYRDAYETIRQAVLESIEQNDYASRHAIRDLKPRLQATVQQNPSLAGPNGHHAYHADSANQPSENTQRQQQSQHQQQQQQHHLHQVDGLSALVADMGGVNLPLGLQDEYYPDAAGADTTTTTTTTMATAASGMGPGVPTSGAATLGGGAEGRGLAMDGMSGSSSSAATGARGNDSSGVAGGGAGDGGGGCGGFDLLLPLDGLPLFEFPHTGGGGGVGDVLDIYPTGAAYGDHQGVDGEWMIM